MKAAEKICGNICFAKIAKLLAVSKGVGHMNSPEQLSPIDLVSNYLHSQWFHEWYPITEVRGPWPEQLIVRFLKYPTETMTRLLIERNNHPRPDDLFLLHRGLGAMAIGVMLTENSERLFGWTRSRGVEYGRPTNANEIRDATQDMAYRLLEDPFQYLCDAIIDPMGLFCKEGDNASRRHLRKARRNQRTIKEFAQNIQFESLNSSESPAVIVSNNDATGAIKIVIKEMKFDILKMYYLEELSAEEIAERTKLSRATVFRHLISQRTRSKELLVPDVIQESRK